MRYSTQVEHNISTGDVESSSDECIGTAAPSTQTSIHGAISGTPSLQQLLEERTPSTQTVVTCVGFREPFYTVLETTMPMFGSTSGGKSGMASAPEKEDAEASKEAKSKEDADHEAACSDPHHDKSTSREMSPPKKPIKPTYQRMLYTTIWSRSHSHCRGWSWITHPTHLRMDRTYNL